MPSRRLNLPLWKKSVFTVLIFVFVFVAADVSGHIYHRLKRGTFLWTGFHSPLVFNVVDLTEPVNDDRVVTLKKSFQTGKYALDENGFRIGLNAYKGKKRIIVFIGDSVPFGWDVPTAASEPSNFAQLLLKDGKPDIGVLNAAIPGYSLRQVVKRYLYEVHGKYSVSAVILQTWDPAGQLALYGKEWTHEKNWSDWRFESKWWYRHENWIKYSSVVYYSTLVFRRLNKEVLQLSPDDEYTRKRFISDNISILQELGTMLNDENVPLYILPVNPAEGVDKEEPPLRAAITWFNEALRSYALTASRTYFLDIEKRFDAAGRKGLFIDDCCHLSDAGAKLQSQIIYDEMTAHGDLDPHK